MITAPPHFHAQYQNYEAKIAIDSLQLLVGTLPKRALLHVLEWAFEHRVELLADWKKVMKHEEPDKIEPLK